MKRLGVIILTGLLWGSFPAIAAYADHDDGGCWEGECYEGDGDGYSQDYEQWNNDQRNHNRRNRGAFSPGPFTDSPVTIIICPPGTQYCGSDGGRNDPPPDERETS